MIVYLDASALVKRYVFEPGTIDVANLLRDATAAGTAAISFAEVAAALAKAARLRALDPAVAEQAFGHFRNEWPDLIRLAITDPFLARAADLAWRHGLRGYDAVHLAAAQTWQDALGESVTLATY